MAKKIEDEDFYHGLLPREDIQCLLRNAGDYLIRSSEVTAGGPRHTIISVAVVLDNAMPVPGQPLDPNTGKPLAIKHVVINVINNKYYCDGKTPFDTVTDMLSHFKVNNISMMPTNPNVIPTNAILRQPWEHRHADVQLSAKLGEGAFGEVYRGFLTLQTRKTVEVAIKLAKSGEMTKEKIKEMMHEARLMRNYDHPNVVKLYGVCVEHEPLMIIMELINGGGLDKYLKENRVSMEEKVENMICGAAWGLEYLHTKSCIHRDIAARNCLYANHTVKISDFGLSREGSQYQMKVVRRVPIRWLAPETIQTLVYNAKTDVWSFGVMVWEIFSNAEEPYPGMTTAEVKDKIQQGYHMDMPQETPTDIARLVTQECWILRPENRPTMTQIVRTLEVVTGKSAPPPMQTGSFTLSKTPMPPTPAQKAVSPGYLGMSMKTERRKKKKKINHNQQVHLRLSALEKELYLHKDDCELSHDFPRRVLTQKTVVDVLKKQFVVWGWDLTTEENRARLEAQMEEADMRRIHREIAEIAPERFPVLLVIEAPQWIHQISDHIDADFDVVSVQKILLERVNSSVEVKNASSEVPYDSMRDELLKEQQMAYEMALAADRAREEQRNKEEAEAQRKREEEERLEREKEAEIERKKAELPEEPSATETNVVALRLRLPGGGMVDRRFTLTERVGFVLTLVESLGFPLATHRAFTSDRPRKNFADLDTEKSFADLKWPRRDVVVVEEIF